jgi:hypothetical protein
MCGALTKRKGAKYTSKTEGERGMIGKIPASRQMNKMEG